MEFQEATEIWSAPKLDRISISKLTRGNTVTPDGVLHDDGSERSPDDDYGDHGS